MWEGYTVQTNLLLIHHQVKTRLLVPFLFPNFSEQQNHGSVPKSIRGSSLGFRVGTRTFHLAGGGKKAMNGRRLVQNLQGSDGEKGSERALS